MTDLVGLVCAVLASLASGVLMAYGVCLAFFRIFRDRRALAVRPLPVSVSAVAEG